MAPTYHGKGESTGEDVVAYGGPGGLIRAVSAAVVRY